MYGCRYIGQMFDEKKIVPGDAHESSKVRTIRGGRRINDPLDLLGIHLYNCLIKHMLQKPTPLLREVGL